MTATDAQMTAADAAPALPAPPLLQVAIHILADGRVVFGDLPPSLAEVARIVAGDGPATARDWPAAGHDEALRASETAGVPDPAIPRDQGSLEGAR